MATRMPGAVWKPISVNFDRGGIEVPSRGLCLHVAQGNSSLYGWFSNSRAQVSSHFWASKTGVIEQYVDCADKAWAEAAGNSQYVSVETEGYNTEFLTDAQLNAVSRIYAWGHSQFGWPFVVQNTPGGQGFTWHGAGGAAWGGHPDCPGNSRRWQMPEILRRAQNGTEDDVVTDDDIRKIVERVWAYAPADVTPPVKQGSLREMETSTYNKVGDVQNQLAYNNDAVTKRLAQVAEAVRRIAAKDGVDVSDLPLL